MDWTIHDRPNDCGGKYIVCNLVFHFTPEDDKEYGLRSDVKNLTDEYVRTFGWEQRPNDLDIIFDHKKYEESRSTVYVMNDNKCVHYIEKFDKFQFREWLEYNPVILAALEGLRALYENRDEDFAKNFKGITAYSGKFFRLLYTLNYWWD